MRLTQEQNKAIISYLTSKKLPLDLLLEVKDHFTEQIENSDTMNFETAFDAAKSSWQEELRMVYKFSLPLRKVTVFQRNIDFKFTSSVLKKTALYFFPFLLTAVTLCFYQKEWAQYLFLFTYAVIGIITALSFLFFFRYYKSISGKNKRNISIYQKGSQIFFIAGIYVFMFNLINFESRFETFYQTLDALVSGNTKGISWFSVLNTFIFLLFWIYGLFYFLHYRKSVSELKHRINFKL